MFLLLIYDSTISNIPLGIMPFTDSPSNIIVNMKSQNLTNLRQFLLNDSSWHNPCFPNQQHYDKLIENDYCFAYKMDENIPLPLLMENQTLVEDITACSDKDPNIFKIKIIDPKQRKKSQKASDSDSVTTNQHSDKTNLVQQDLDRNNKRKIQDISSSEKEIIDVILSPHKKRKNDKKDADFDNESEDTVEEQAEDCDVVNDNQYKTNKKKFIETYPDAFICQINGIDYVRAIDIRNKRNIFPTTFGRKVAARSANLTSLFITPNTHPYIFQKLKKKNMVDARVKTLSFYPLSSVIDRLSHTCKHTCVCKYKNLSF